jgi:hypothetical protein
MIRFSFIVLMVFTCNLISALPDSTHYPPYHRSNRSGYLKIAGQIGGSAGQETFIGAPRGGIFLDFGWNYRNKGRRLMNWDSFSDFGFHAGPQASILVFFGGWFSYGLNAGISLKPFTVDVSFSRTLISSPGGETVGRDNTINPKLGLCLGPVWIQGGPSFAMNGKDSNLNNIIKIRGQAVNFEVSYIVEL